MAGEVKMIKAGLLQFDVRMGDIDGNWETVSEGIVELADSGADIVILPEMWSCGFDNRNLAVHGKRTEEILERLSDAAANHHVLIAGSMPENFSGGVFNTTFLVERDGRVAGKYRKVHLFSHSGENRHFLAGNRAVVCDTSIGKVGLTICYDLRFPELFRVLADKGAVLILNSAQWPDVRVHHWDILLQARAIENQLFVAAANRCGDEKKLRYGGHSQIVSPTGNILAKAGDDPQILTASLDYNEITEYRNSIPSLDERVPDAYTLN